MSLHPVTNERVVAPPVRITVCMQDGDKVRQYIAEGADFDDALRALRKMNPALVQRGTMIIGECT